jgi:hypothetical protein
VAATDEDDGVGSTSREQAGSEGAIQVGSDDEEDDEEETDEDYEVDGVGGDGGGE